MVPSIPISLNLNTHVTSPQKISKVPPNLIQIKKNKKYIKVLITVHSA
jgi:hypothetical protein